jgi:hypothetical protein
MSDFKRHGRVREDGEDEEDEWGGYVTCVPSGRFDSGITLSRVPGSTVIPERVAVGFMGGLDMRSV